MSTNFTVVFSPEAIHDLHAIHDYIAGQFGTPQAARKQVSQIRTVARSLESFPLRHPLADHPTLASKNVRKLMVGNYAIFYCANEQTGKVVVSRIIYGGRDFGKLTDSIA